MKRPQLMFVALLLCTPIFAARKSAVKTQTATLESVRSKVEVKSASGDRWRSAKSNAKVETSDVIRTGKQSTARVRLSDGSKILILQNSQAEMENLSSVQKAIKLVKGRVRAVVKRLKGGSQFQIKTPVGVASVRGTDFEVEFSEEGGEMVVDVHEGRVGVAKLGDLEGEILINSGERIKFGLEGEIGDPIKTGAIPLNRQDVRTEVAVARVKESIVSLAAEESRNADYQVGKTLVDIDGQRVRVEEYIMRPAPDQFKLVALNERANRFDYFTYTGTFNQDLPEDLSIALSQVGGKLGATQPDYFLESYEMVMSNTQDSVTDASSGGHLVQIDFDGTNYTLTDPNDPSNTRTIEAAELQGDGSYNVYNPLRDSFQLVSADNLSDALNVGVLDNGTYRNLTAGDVYWDTRFNSNSYSINDRRMSSFVLKSSINNMLAWDLDIDNALSEQPIKTFTEFPSGDGNLHNRLSLYYADGSVVEFDNYFIDDEGSIAPTSAFEGITTSAAYKNELNKWNYQQKVTATDGDGNPLMSDQINLVIDPRIGTMSGLIQ